ncbi:MAG: hypothetical protein ACK5M4_09285 [Pseudorhodobacter sp.]
MTRILPQVAHMAAAEVGVPADFALARLADAEFLGGWSLGSMDLQPLDGGVFRGRSLFDGAPAHIEIHVSETLGLIDYAVGTAEHRSARIFIRVTPGPVLGQGAESCVVTLHALRAATASDAAWTRTCTVHETEILLIKAQLETALTGQSG